MRASFNLRFQQTFLFLQPRPIRGGCDQRFRAIGIWLDTSMSHCAWLPQKGIQKRFFQRHNTGTNGVSPLIQEGPEKLHWKRNTYISCFLCVRHHGIITAVTAIAKFRCNDDEAPPMSSNYVTLKDSSGKHNWFERQRILHNYYLEEDGTLVIEVDIRIRFEDKCVWYPKEATPAKRSFGGSVQRRIVGTLGLRLFCG